MIVISVGANIGRADKTALETLEAAVSVLEGPELGIMKQSRWYRSAPVPPSAQPDYINGVLLVETDLDPWCLLEIMHGVEARFGRKRAERWAARTLDLDLVDYRGFLTFNGWRGGQWHRPVPGELCLPHPRAHERAFVLRPLAEISPEWRHPVLNRDARSLLAGAVAAQRCEPMDGAGTPESS